LLGPRKGLLKELKICPVLHCLINCVTFQVVPHEHEERISTPSFSPQRRRRGPTPSVPRQPRRPVATPAPRCSHHCREPSLTTISEEPNSWQSATHEVVVQPELILETTTHHYHHNHPPPGKVRAKAMLHEPHF
jgi:hypothetical protein